MGTKHVSYAFDFKGTQFTRMPRDKDYGDVMLAKNKNKGAPKLLLVLDWMPSEDIGSGRLLSGATGALLNNILQVTEKFYNGKKLEDFDWLAISHSVFKTIGESDSFKDAAYLAFDKRLQHVILEYKPDTVVTFGPKPFQALNRDKITYANKNSQNWYGVPIPTKVKSGSEKHKFLHVPTLSLNTLVNAESSGAEMGVAGYIARNLVNALDQELRYSIPKMPEFKTVYVDTIKKFDKMMKDIRGAVDVAIDTETENLLRIKNKMLTIQFATTVDKAYVLPYYHKDSPFLPRELRYIQKRLKKYFEKESADQLHVYTNAVFDLNVMRNNLDIRFFCADLWDMFAGEYVLDENMKFLQSVSGGYYYSLGNLSMQYGCTAYYDIEFGKEMRKTIVNTDMTRPLIEYCALDVIIPLLIKAQQIRRGKHLKYEKYKHMVRYQSSDMLHSFSTWEHNGVKTDINYLFFLKSRESPIRTAINDLQSAFKDSKAVKKADARLQKANGTPTVGLWGATTSTVFNIGTKKHLHMLMFDILKLKPLSRGKMKNDGSKGDGKIDKKFQKTYKHVPEVAMFTQLQGAKKLYSSYVKSFIKQWGRDIDLRSDSRIRPHFKFIDVVTGRTSASDPSLHQIPSRSELGKNIKRLFVTEAGRIVIKVDYSAHEVRCILPSSYLSTDRGMIMLQDIIDMRPQDRPLVHSYNHETGLVELKAIGTTSVHAPEEDMYEIAYEGGTISVTGNHQIWSVTRNQYIRADDIQEGEELLRSNGMSLIQNIRKIARPKLVCDVGIEDNHNLFVCDSPTGIAVLVHNCWSLITGDRDIAEVFNVGRVFRQAFKLSPNKKTAEEIFFKGDVHKINAAYFFGVDISAVDKALRDAVKGVIFGLIYQQGVKGLSAATGQTEDAIITLIAKFFKRFPVGVKWFDTIKAFGKKHLYVESPLGRRRHLWGHLTPKGARNTEGITARTERQSVNSPVQGLGSDYLIIGSREIEREKFAYGEKTGRMPDFHLCNSVHDSIEIDCAYEDVWAALQIVEKGLTDCVAARVKERYGQEFTVPLEIDFEIGPTGKHVKEWNYDINTLQGIIKESLRFQKKHLDHDIDRDALYDHVFTKQYKDMPEWAQKQAWNKGMEMKGMKKDPRSAKETIKSKNKPVWLKGTMTDVIEAGQGASSGTGMNSRME